MNSRSTNNMITVLDDRSRSHYAHQAANLLPSDSGSAGENAHPSNARNEDTNSIRGPWLGDLSSAPEQDAVRSVEVG